jgi:hypothetical protein
MTHARPFSEAHYLQLKAATRRVVRASGGVDAASLTTRVGMQRISTYQKAHEPDFIPIDVAADLMAESGDHAVLIAMARLLGCEVIRLPALPEVDAMPWHRSLADVASHSSDVIRRLSDALADDGIVDAEESRRGAIRDEIAEAINVLMVLESRLARIEETS